jgi:hypothetical protein
MIWSIDRVLIGRWNFPDSLSSGHSEWPQPPSGRRANGVGIADFGRLRLKRRNGTSLELAGTGWLSWYRLGTEPPLWLFVFDTNARLIA